MKGQPDLFSSSDESGGTEARIGPVEIREHIMAAAEDPERPAPRPDPEEIAELHRASRGIPGHVEFLLRQRRNDPAYAVSRPGRRYVFAAAIGLTMCFTGYYYLTQVPGVDAGSDPAAGSPPGPADATGGQSARRAPESAATPLTAASPPALRGGDWLARQPADAWVLQLIGAAEPETINRFLAVANLPPSQLTLVHTQRAGAPWHVLLYGLYADRDAARADAALLPVAARAQKPWPRRAGSVIQTAQ